MAILTPSTFQTGSVGLKRAGDPDAQSRIAGLELGLTAPNGAWPTLTCRGGVRLNNSRLISVAQEPGTFNGAFKTIAQSVLGAISVPGDTVPTPTETSDWSFVKLGYAVEFDVTLSRATPGMLLETSATSLRLCSGTVATKRVKTSATVITETTNQMILPKYVAWHRSDGYQVALLSTNPNLAGIDQPWLLVWWGNQSHWVDTTKPSGYGVSSSAFTGTQGMPARYAFQADCPLLLVSSANPTAISQNASAGGFDLTFSAGAKKLSTMPLYGRLRQDAATTETWGAGLPSGVQSKVSTVYPYLGYFPSSVAESYAYTAGTDTATITERVTWTTVLASGGQKLTPLPPVLATARDTSLAITRPSVTDLGVPTEYGPTQGIVGVDEYDWAISGLASYATSRSAPGAGAVPTGLQSRIDAEVDKLVSQAHWQPWALAVRAPNATPGGDIYYSDPTDTVAQASELVPVVSGARQTALKAWLATERAAYPPETTHTMSATAGTARGPSGTPGAYHGYWTAAGSLVAVTRRDVWAAWGLARYHHESGAAPGAGLTASLLGVLNADLAEQDWGTMHWLAGQATRQTAVENAARYLAGLLGLAWIASQQAPADSADTAALRCLLAKAVVSRVAMLHLPRWQASVGLVTLPTDLGSAALNAAWLPSMAPEWPGIVNTYDWADSMDDPRCPVKVDQFQAYLHDSPFFFGWAIGGMRSYLPHYRALVRPVAALLETACPGEAEIAAQKVRELYPHWWLPWMEATLGQEANVAQPMDSYGVLLARAWLESADAPTLEREAAYPWLASGADLMTLHKMAEAARVYADQGPPPGPYVTNLTDNLATYTGSQVPRHSLLELTFDVAQMTATNPYLPYDAAPPAGQSGTIGITVDLELSRAADFASYQTMPCFSWEGWGQAPGATYGVKGGLDWIYPDGVSAWKARFNPEQTGSWWYRVRTTDAGGTNVTDAVPFTVIASSAKGPLRPSPADIRYFEHADGSPFNGLGLNLNGQRLSWNDPEQVSRPILEALAENGLRLARIFMIQHGSVIGTSSVTGAWTSTRGIGSQAVPSFWTTEATPVLGYVSDGTAQMGGRVSQFTMPLLGRWVRSPACKRSTTYRARIRYMIPTTLTGPLSGSGSYGLCMKLSTVFPESTTSVGGQTVFVPQSPSYGTVVGGTRLTAATGGWVEATLGTFTTRSTQDFLDYVILAPDNVSGGNDACAFVSHVWIEEDLGGGSYGPNIVSRPDFAWWRNVDQRMAEAIDRLVDAAEDTGVFLKLVMLEKQDWFLQLIDATTGAPRATGSPSEAQFYGTTTSRSRWLHKAYARYCHGRWGHSPAVHWEFVNESNTGVAGNFGAANQWGGVLKAFANAKMVTTSTANQMPAALWNGFPNADYCDIHAYQDDALPTTTTTVKNSTNVVVHRPSDFYDSAEWVRYFAETIGARHPTYGMGKQVMAGEGCIAQAGTDRWAPIIYTSAATMAKHWHKWAWGHIGAGGAPILGEWHPELTMYRTAAPIYDARPDLKPFADFIRDVPLNNGLYADATATASDPNLRVFGQKDTTNLRAHLWIDNLNDTLGRMTGAVAGGWPASPVAGTVSLAMPAGSYTATWINAYTGATIQTDTVASSGTMTLTLPQAVSTDIAVTLAPAVTTAQRARPLTTVGDGGWSAVNATSLADALDESTPSDVDLIASPFGPNGAVCTIGLSSLSDPGTSGGHVVRYRYARDAAGTNPVTLTVELLSGATVIATWTHANVGATPVTAVQTLSASEANSIADYSSLLLRFTADEVTP